MMCRRDPAQRALRGAAIPLLVDLVGLAAAATPVQAQTITAGCAPEQSLRWRGGTLRLENDLFAGTDQNYSNGVALALVSHDIEGRLRPECPPPPLGLYTRFLAWANPGFWTGPAASSVTQNVVMRIGQSMYTPEDETRSDLIADDRPYAGLLYLGLAWNRRAHAPGARFEVLDTRELTLGVIGPGSLARQSQNLIHDLRGIDRFRGWSHQLRNERALQLALERKFKPHAEGAIQPGWGATPSLPTRCAWGTSKPLPAPQSSCAPAGTCRTTSAATRSAPVPRTGRPRPPPPCAARARRPRLPPGPACTPS